MSSLTYLCSHSVVLPAFISSSCKVPSMALHCGDIASSLPDAITLITSIIHSNVCNCKLFDQNSIIYFIGPRGLTSIATIWPIVFPEACIVHHKAGIPRLAPATVTQQNNENLSNQYFGAAATTERFRVVLFNFHIWTLRCRPFVLTTSSLSFSWVFSSLSPVPDVALTAGNLGSGSVGRGPPWQTTKISKKNRAVKFTRIGLVEAHFWKQQLLSAGLCYEVSIFVLIIHGLKRNL